MYNKIITMYTNKTYYMNKVLEKFNMKDYQV